MRARNDELDRIFLELMSLYRDILMYQLGIRDGWINAGEDELIAEQGNRDTADTTRAHRRHRRGEATPADDDVTGAHRRIRVRPALESVAGRGPGRRA